MTLQTQPNPDSPFLLLNDLLSVGPPSSTLNPYSHAFLLALHTCRHIEVEMGGQGLCVATEEILRRDRVLIASAPRFKGARIRLTGGTDRLVLGGYGDLGPHVTSDSMAGDIQVSRANHIFQGFPIPVFVDGIEAARTCAQSPEFQPCEVGVFAVLDDPLEEGPYMPPEIYLNGVRVDLATASAPSSTVIHLDPDQFHADPADHRRVMESDCEPRVAEVLAGLLVQELQQIAVRDPDLLWHHRPALLSAGLLHLLCRASVIPASLIYRPDLEHITLGGHPRSLRQQMAIGDISISRRDLEAAALIIPMSVFSAWAGRPSEHPESLECLNIASYAAGLEGALLVDTVHLPHGHWLFELPNFVPEPTVRVCPFETDLHIADLFNTEDGGVHGASLTASLHLSGPAGPVRSGLGFGIDADHGIVIESGCDAGNLVQVFTDVARPGRDASLSILPRERMRAAIPSARVAEPQPAEEPRSS